MGINLRKTIAFVLVVLVVTSVSLAYYTSQNHNTVRIEISGVTLTVELARTQSEQQRGLSGRDSMPSDSGMLFIFDGEGYWSFWMHEMRFPLDIIWFDSGRHAVFIEQGLKACGPDVCPSYTPTTKAMYVLEVNAGFVASHIISLGDVFAFLS